VPETATEIEQEIRIDASPETVFSFLTDPSRMVQWKGRQATLDPRPGGIYRVEINDQATARGEYVEVTPPSRVVFTWGWAGEANPVPPGSSRVEIDLVRDGDGTILRLRHSDLPEEARAAHAEGWETYLARLAAAAAGLDPGPDPHSQMPRP
jgi:uncharacterized protein YndB with AHSA1/START domain